MHRKTIQSGILAVFSICAYFFGHHFGYNKAAIAICAQHDQFWMGDLGRCTSDEEIKMYLYKLEAIPESEQQ